MSYIFLSEQANENLKNYLRIKGHKLIEIGKTDVVYDAISSHADIYLCKLGNTAVISKELFSSIKNQLLEADIPFKVGSSSLGFQYPENVKYNAVQMGNYFIHNTGYTDPTLLELAISMNLRIIHVNQGYTKCSLVVVDEQSAITSDAGLAKTLGNHGLDILMISQGFVKLSGFPYGFLGGASGRAGNEIIFHGNLSVHPDYQKIKDFIQEKGLRLVQFQSFELEDIGSLL